MSIACTLRLPFIFTPSAYQSMHVNSYYMLLRWNPSPSTIIKSDNPTITLRLPGLLFILSTRKLDSREHTRTLDFSSIALPLAILLFLPCPLPPFWFLAQWPPTKRTVVDYQVVLVALIKHHPHPHLYPYPFKTYRMVSFRTEH